MRNVRRLFADDAVPERRLEASVACLPLSVRIAMLDGVRCERIIAGAYTDGAGGVCPMLAAHRRGARYSFLPFAKAWDAFANAPFRGHRPATPDAVSHLAALLRHSIECELRVPLELAADQARSVPATRSRTEQFPPHHAVAPGRDGALTVSR